MRLSGTKMVDAARRVAAEAHLGQADKLGERYILHPARVSHRVRSAGPEHEAVAWLHDVVEDTRWTPADLTAAGFPPEVVAGVVAMTKLPDDGPLDAIHRACANPIAMVVKAADVADNTDPARQGRLDEATRQRLCVKYDTYRQVLRAHGAPAFASHVELSDAEVALVS